jgi:photosystem II stability/assembly factor-like uncharacterized protein
MDITSMKRSGFLLLAALQILFVAGSVGAQTWTRSAVGLFAFHRDNGAAICYKHGTLWAGYDRLYCSTDLGATWSQRSVPGTAFIHKIAFGDAMHGYCLRYGSLFRTTDGGTTWLQVSTSMSTGQGLTCSDDGKRVYVVTSNGTLLKSTDYGASWTSSVVIPTSDRFIGDVLLTSAGVLRLVTGFNPTTRVYTSYNDGVAWQSTLVGQGDTWSGAVDSCGGESIYLANEDYWARLSTKSNIFASTDGAATWRSALTIDTPGLNGSVAVGAGLVAAQSIRRGVYLSDDKGKNWSLIGGPPEGQDSRALVILPDASIFCGATDGSIWRYLPGTSAPLPGQLFEFDTLSACLDSIPRSLVVPSNICSKQYVSYHITGSDSDAYSLRLTRTQSGSGDSLIIVFTPLHDSLNKARLVLSMEDGSQSYCDLLGNGYGGITVAPQVQSSVSTRAIGEEIVVPLDLDFNQPVANVSFTVRYDTAAFIYHGTNLAEGTALDAAPFDRTGKVLLKVPAGYIGQHIVAESRFACFPRYDSSSDIHFDAVTWTARTGGCLSVLDTSFSTPISFPITCGEAILSDFVRYGAAPLMSIRPNPAKSEIVVSIRNLEEYSIHVTNVAGSSLLQKRFQKPGDQKLNLDGLPRGTYIVSVHSERGWTRSMVIEKE